MSCGAAAAVTASRPINTTKRVLKPRSLRSTEKFGNVSSEKNNSFIFTIFNVSSFPKILRLTAAGGLETNVNNEFVLCLLRTKSEVWD